MPVGAAAGLCGEGERAAVVSKVAALRVRVRVRSNVNVLNHVDNERPPAPHSPQGNCRTGAEHTERTRCSNVFTWKMV